MILNHIKYVTYFTNIFKLLQKSYNYIYNYNYIININFRSSDSIKPLLKQLH